MSFSEWFDWIEHVLGDSGHVCTRCGERFNGGHRMQPGTWWISVSGCPRIYISEHGTGPPSDPDDRITLCSFVGDA